MSNPIPTQEPTEEVYPEDDHHVDPEELQHKADELHDRIMDRKAEEMTRHEGNERFLKKFARALIKTK